MENSPTANGLNSVDNKKSVKENKLAEGNKLEKETESTDDNKTDNNKPLLVKLVHAHFKVIEQTINVLKEIPNKIAPKRNPEDTEKDRNGLHRIFYEVWYNESVSAELTNPSKVNCKFSHELYNKASGYIKELLWKMKDLDLKRLLEKLKWKLYANLYDGSPFHDIPAQ